MYKAYVKYDRYIGTARPRPRAVVGWGKLLDQLDAAVAGLYRLNDRLDSTDPGQGFDVLD
jgi:hypothetical protein